MNEHISKRIDSPRHESPLIGGSFCNGCLCLEVMTQGKRHVKERYYCRHQRGYFNPFDVSECVNEIRKNDAS